LKKYEKIIVASSDNVITIWKIKYSNVGSSHVIDDNLYCESIFKENFGGINSISTAVKGLPYIFVGNQLGQLKLYNYELKKFELDTM